MKTCGTCGRAPITGAKTAEGKGARVAAMCMECYRKRKEERKNPSGPVDETRGEDLGAEIAGAIIGLVRRTVREELRGAAVRIAGENRARVARGMTVGDGGVEGGD